MARLFRYLLALFHDDFYGTVTIPFKGRGKLGQITVTQGFLADTIPNHDPSPAAVAAIDAELRRLAQPQRRMTDAT